jgi:putative hydrolase of the HAD superfamily
VAERHDRNSRHERRFVLNALVLDFGGVLTNDFWEVLRSFARREGLQESALVDLVTKDPEGIELLRDLERGSIGQAQFEREISARLGLPAEGLLQSMAADLRPDEEMLALVEELRAAGVKIGILSNSWGSDYFDPYAPWNLQERSDVVIISDQVRLRKPDPEIFDIAIDKLGVPASDCLFVDDIAAYLEPARAKGMAVWHHTSTPETVAELRRVFETYLH